MKRISLKKLQRLSKNKRSMDKKHEYKQGAYRIYNIADIEYTSCKYELLFSSNLSVKQIDKLYNIYRGITT